ncbi:ABC transporter ATP-binding protein [Salirhabdus sp. Marseille-P4669]|uniref:ABC transporter ATP-binding protein n=1 Tax=Salirhabdus sp. Marseille-P4669 TaxID=2042310 RepID=UPI001F343759|nr:ABC transporter ATP-binding protein [Salirhabdus sp. Marseille-P4669]
MGSTISCINVTKSFHGDGIKINALHNVDVEFQEGEFVSIVGPSGSGKSTLLSLLGTLDQPSTGEVRFDGQTSKLKKKGALADFRFENIGFVFQQFHLLPTLTSLENVMSPLLTRKVSYNKRERATEVLKQVGLEDKLHSLPSQLSGGQQQRVAIARAMVNQPKWLLADEPTGNLDTETGEIIFEVLTKLNRKNGCGLLYVTHDPNLAARADRMIEMKDGGIIHDSSRGDMV